MLVSLIPQHAATLPQLEEEFIPQISPTNQKVLANTLKKPVRSFPFSTLFFIVVLVFASYYGKIQYEQWGNIQYWSSRAQVFGIGEPSFPFTEKKLRRYREDIEEMELAMQRAHEYDLDDQGDQGSQGNQDGKGNMT